MLEAFLTDLLEEGRVVVRAPRLEDLDERPSPAVLARLEGAFADHALEVAGPPVSFDPALALAAAVLLQRACWLSVHPEVTTASLEGPREAPQSAAAHLSADLLLRFAPLLHRRARAHQGALAGTLRRFPLSGVLADLEEPPLSFDLAGHEGLELLYAERLARHPRAAWMPPWGSLRERARLAFVEAGVSPGEDAP